MPLAENLSADKNIDFWVRHYLKINKTPNAQIRTAVNNIFIGKRKVEPKFRSLVISKHPVPSKQGTFHYTVKSGQQIAIYNALCLLNILSTKDTSALFENFYHNQHNRQKIELEMFEDSLNKHFLEFFSLGLVRSNIGNIQTCLLDDSFHLFKDKLPSPFGIQDTEALTTSLDVWTHQAPWQEYFLQYQKAETLLEQQQFEQAIDRLEQLKQTATVKLPVVESLLSRLLKQQHDAINAINYLKKFNK